MFVELLTIGDELCRGEIVNTNASWLAKELWDGDLTVRWMTSCRDDVDDMRHALTAAAGRADLIITSGGLGPTEDDLTVDVVAGMIGAEAVVDADSLAKMEARFPGRAAKIPNMVRQVRVPGGARVFANPAGLAPSFEVGFGAPRPVPLICLPGVPREIYAIFDAGLRARVTELRAARGDIPRMAKRIYRVFGLGESQIAAGLVGVVGDQPGASIHYQVKFPEVLVKIVARGDDAAARLATVEARIRATLGDSLYSIGDDALPEVVVRGLITGGKTVATAESCTGGLVAELLTSVPGASATVRGGAIAYANEEKSRQLGVAPGLLKEHGAVSEACVRAMAVGACERFGVDAAVAVSGVAGPDGGTEANPVGTVWLAAATRGGTVLTHRILWPGARDQVRLLAAWWALHMLRRICAMEDA